jgi:hypothetical protein
VDVCIHGECVNGFQNMCACGGGTQHLVLVEAEASSILVQLCHYVHSTEINTQASVWPCTCADLYLVRKIPFVPICKLFTAILKIFEGQFRFFNGFPVVN